MSPNPKEREAAALRAVEGVEPPSRGSADERALAEAAPGEAPSARGVALTEAAKGSDDVTPSISRSRQQIGSGAFDDAARISSRRQPFGDCAPLLALPVVDPDMYAIAGEFARGGLGRVLRARDKRLGRIVALKVLLASERDALRRFVREAVVTARLQHPGIVPIYEAGRFPDGRPFYAMRLVSGEPLAALLRRARGLEGRLALLPHVIRAAEAIAYAHSRGVIHRDLKPDNIVVGEIGEAVVIDWGLAKTLSKDDEPEDPLDSDTSGAITRTGIIVGTPSYMAPEQARGASVDERADVYALGAILYRLLAGHRPYNERNPARVIQMLAHGPPPPLEARAPGAPRELVAIAVKAMARTPEARYRSARELADDLQRFEAGQLVAAHRYTQGQLVRRWLGRHAVAVIAALTTLSVLASVGALALRGVLAERDREASARQEARLAEARSRGAELAALAAKATEAARADDLALRAARAALERDPTESVAWLKQLSPSWARWDAVSPVALAASRRGVADLLSGHEGGVAALAFSPDGRRLASGGSDRSVRVWDLAGGGVVLTGPTGNVTGVAFAPSGRSVAASSRDGVVRVWDLAGGAPRELSIDDAVPLSVAYAADGERLAVSYARGAVAVFHLARGGREISRDHRGAAVAVAYAPDGERLASIGEDGVVFLRDRASPRGRALAREGAALTALAFAPDGRRLAYAAADGSIHLLDVDGGGGRVFARQPGTIVSLAFSADGQILIAASAETGVTLFRLATGSSRELAGGAGARAAALSPDGAKIALGSSDRMVRIFRAGVDEPPPADGLRAWISATTNAVVGPDGALTAEEPFGRAAADAPNPAGARCAGCAR